jgi:hypothetical protein
LDPAIGVNPARRGGGTSPEEEGHDAKECPAPRAIF